MNRRITSTLIVSALIASSTLAGCSSKADPSAMRSECSKIADILGVVLEDLVTINDGLGQLDVAKALKFSALGWGHVATFTR